MIDIRQRLLVVFNTEAKEHLARIRSILEQSGEGTAGASLDEVFRRAHSLKGAARAVDLRIVENLAHPLETLFARVREKTLKFDRTALKIVGEVLDGIEDCIANQLAGKAAQEPVKLLAGITAFVDPSSPGSAVAEAAPISVRPSSQRAALPAAPVAVEIEQVPAFDRRTSDRKFADVDTVRVNVAVVERLHRSTGQLATENQRQGTMIEKLNALGQQVAGIEHEWALVRKASSVVLRRMESNPELSRVARYLSFVERKLAALGKETRELSAYQKHSARALRNLGGEIEQDVRGARMVLAENVFDHFGKMMRDLSKAEGRQISFKMTGLDVEADRMVLLALKDPLMHLLRNTIAHGIEAPAERVASGKSEAGNILLTVAAAANRLTVTLQDDGRGVDLDRVTAAAISKHLISDSAARALSPDERIRLIFHPGISTNRAVTELSGRGMGLSVVAEAVAHMQGSVEVTPNAPSGTRFVISVPLAISTNRLLLLKCRDQRFALVTHAIERLQRVRIKDVVHIEGRPSITVDGALIPLTPLAHVLKLGDTGVLAERDVIPVVVLRSGEKRIALAVDGFIAEMEGMIKDLSPVIMRAGKLSGGILMGDGSVVLVLNPAELVEAFLRLDRMPALETVEKKTEKRTPTILVVDDSMTTRTLEKSILEAHGYVVLVAVDGIEALAQLRSTQVDLVVSDVEMPRLDGFGLLEEIRGDPLLAKIPLILVTSLEKREDKERGLALGADGYLVKRKFDQKILLDTVRQIL